MSEIRSIEQVVEGFCNCKACTDRTTEMYELPLACVNCGWSGKGRYRKGDRAGDLQCPACGCWNTARPRIP